MIDAPKPQSIPTDPGVYLFKDAALRVIYVGKARSLRKRVASYFRDPARHTPKTRAMLGQAASLDTLVTATEKEALLLEASLIKKHRPRYNIVLRDDKQYLLFRLDKESAFPRLAITRRVDAPGSVYFGPFTSGLAARETWRAIHNAFPLRRCKDSVMKNRVRPCIYHQIGGCPAPCVLDVDRAAYADMVRRVEMLLSGRSAELVGLLEQEMRQASEALEYERAAVLRDQMRAVQRTVERQAAVLAKPLDLDVIGMHAEPPGGKDDEDRARGARLAVSLLFVRQGRLLDKKSFVWPGIGPGFGPEEGAEAVAGFVAQYYGPGRFIPETLLLPPGIAEHWPDFDLASAELAEVLAERRGAPVRVKMPHGQVEKRLAAMARANAAEATRAGAADTPEALLADVGKRLGLAGPAEHIEAVDVSHTSGGAARVGMVVFEHGDPRKDAYRLYTLKEEIEPGDDYAALAEWARRRTKAGPPWPDLVLVDGGKGQLAAVVRALREAGAPKELACASIAKEHAAQESGGAARRHARAVDRIFLPGRKNPLSLPGGSRELLFLQRVRDAVHDYVIRRHRRARNRAGLSGGLTGLPGVGVKTARLLWDRFDSVEAMASATPDALTRIPGIGPAKARSLKQALAAFVRRKRKGA